MADIQLLINKLNKADTDKTVIQQDISPIDNLINKINKKETKAKTLVDELQNNIKNMNSIKGTVITGKQQGFDGFTDIPEVEGNEHLYSQVRKPLSIKGLAEDTVQGLKNSGNAFLYGYLNSVSSFYNTLANIPGGLSSLSKYASNKFGKSLEDAYNEDNESGLTYAFDAAEDYLRNLSVQFNPHSENPYFDTEATFGYRPTDPDSFSEKLTSAFAAAPVTIGEYIPATRLLKSMPLGFAATDALRESDKGLEEAGVAGAKGYILGRIMKVLEPFNVRTRVTAMSALGYGATDGNYEDKLVGGITFGALSAIGNLDGKNIGQAKRDLNAYLSGQNAKQYKFHREVEAENNKQLTMIENKANEYTQLNEQLILAKDAAGKGEKTLGEKEIASLETRINKLEGEIYTLRDNYNKTNAFAEMSKEFLDLRSIQTVVSSLVKPVKVTVNKKTKKKEYEYEPTEKDISTTKIGSIINEFIFQAAPSRFVGKATNSLFKKGVDLVTQNRIAAENTIDAILRNPVFNKADPYFINVIKGLIPRSGKEISILPANQYAKTGRDPNSIEAILETNSKFLNGVIEKLPAIEKFASKNRKNDELFNKKEGDLTNKALIDNFNFNKNEVLVYKTLRRGLKESLKFYNEMGAKYGGSQFTPVKELPSYFPHIWMSDFRIFVRKESNNELITVLPASNIATAKGLEKIINLKLDGVKTKIDSAQRTGDMQVNIFAETMNFLRNNKELAKEVRNVFEANYIKQGFNIHKMPRKQQFVDGYLGANTNIYTILGVPKSIANMKRTSDFVRGYMAYIQGAVRSGYQIQLRRNLKDLTMDKNISKHYKNTVELLNRYYSGVFSGDFASLKNSKGNTHPIDALFENKYINKYLGANFIDRFVNRTNSFTLTTRLLMYNMRFALSQVIQPYQMIAMGGQLARLRAIGEGGSPMEAFFKSQKDLIAPSKEAKEVIQEAVKNRNISAAFINEFSSAIRGKSFKNFEKILNAVTGKGFSARLEQFSRMNATLMFYHSLREGGMSHKMAKDRAWQLSDTYMVEYNATQRPMLYGSSGLLGRTAGRSFGLFKTFQHNYLAQMVEHIRTTQKTGDLMPTASFAASMVFTAGLYGVIGIETADILLSTLDKTVGELGRKFRKGFRIPTFSEWLYENNFHPYLLFGVPSTQLNTDLTATLAAPSMMGLDTVFTMPPGFQLLSNVGTATSNYLGKKWRNIETPGDAMLFHNSYAPNIMKPFIEAYYNAKMTGKEADSQAAKIFPPLAGPELVIEYLKDVESGETGVVVVGAGDKVRAKINRDMTDWSRRLFSSYTIKEAYINKVIWHTTKMKNRKAMKEEDWTEYAASSVLKGAGIPDDYIDYMATQGYSGSRIITKVKNKVKDLTQDVIFKNLKGDVTIDKQKLADIITNDYIKID